MALMPETWADLLTVMEATIAAADRDRLAALERERDEWWAKAAWLEARNAELEAAVVAHRPLCPRCRALLDGLPGQPVRPEAQ